MIPDNHHAFDGPLILWIYLPFFVLSMTVGNIILVNYIIHNRDNMYKTLIDELFGHVAFYSLVWTNCLIQPLTLARMILGPFPETGEFRRVSKQPQRLTFIFSLYLSDPSTPIICFWHLRCVD